MTTTPTTPKTWWHTTLHNSKPSLLAATGQGLGALQALAIIYYLRTTTGTPHETTYKNDADAYFFFFATATIPGAMISLGLIYALWLRHRWGTKKHFHRATTITTTISLTASITAYLYYTTVKDTPPPLTTFILIATGGTLTTLVHLYAAKIATTGNANWLSATTTLTNLLGLGALLASHGNIQWLAAGQLLGTATYLAAIIHHTHKNPLTHTTTHPATPSEIISLSIRAICGYGLVLAWQAAVIRLTPGQTTTFNVIARIANGLATVIVNAPLPKLINTHTIKENHLWRFTGIIVLTSTLINTTCLALHHHTPHPLTAACAIGITWFSAIGLNAITQRYIAATHSADRIYYIAAAVTAMMALALTLPHHPNFNLPWIFAAVITTEIITCLAASIRTTRIRPNLLWSTLITFNATSHILLLT